MNDLKRMETATALMAAANRRIQELEAEVARQKDELDYLYRDLALADARIEGLQSNILGALRQAA